MSTADPPPGSHHPTSSAKILLVEDDPKTVAFVRKGLVENGYAVDDAGTGPDGLARALAGGYDLLVLDVMLPAKDGWAVLRDLRAAGVPTPVLFLTARDSIPDRVTGLELGADDYLVKPFAFAELLARIRTVLRRGAGRSPDVVRVADLTIDLVRQKVTRGGAAVDLTPKEFSVLALLARRTGEVLSRDLITEHVWDVKHDPGTNIVDVHIRRLRAKIDDPFEAKLIHTVRGRVCPRSPPPDPGRRPWSIALRLTIWYAVAAFALVLTATGYLYWALARNLDREDDQFLADKMREVRRALADRPDDRAALEQEVQAGGTDREPGRFLVRITQGADAGDDHETRGMAAILPAAVFPEVGPDAPERAADYQMTDGRWFRLSRYYDRVRGRTVQVAMDRSADDELLAEYREQLVYVLGASLLAAAGGGYWIARRGMRPVADVTATARRIRPAHMGERIDPAGLPAEVRDLAETFNNMLDRLNDAFTRLGRFSADIAHELRTPLSNLRGVAEVGLGRPRTPEEYREVLSSCLEECDRLAQLIDSLLFLARAEDPKTELRTTVVDAAAELGVVREFFGTAAAEAAVRLEVEAAPGLALRADRQLLQRAVGNLVANALAHTPGGGRVTLFAARDGMTIRVGVRDTGAGIAAEHLPYVFDRFYRAEAARSSGQGRVGLGLAIVKGIAELHRGTVAAVSAAGRGTTVTLTFPLKAE